MADPFSIATGALTVAEVGLKLHKTLKEYIEGVVNADKHYRRIADEVRTTSWALQELGAQLQSEDGGDLGIFKPAAKIETKAALDGCQDTFKELEELLNLSMKVEAVSGSSSSSLSRISKLKFPGRNKKIKSLLGELERLKTTLLLICHIIPAAKRVAEKDALPVQDRVQLEYLIKAWKDAKDIGKHPLSTVDTTQSGVDSGTSGTTFVTLGQNLGSVSDALSSVPSGRHPVENNQVTPGLNADDVVTADYPSPGSQHDMLPSVHNATTSLPNNLLHAYPFPAKVPSSESPVPPSRPRSSNSGTAGGSAGHYRPQDRLQLPLLPPKPKSISPDDTVRSAISDLRQEMSSQLDACASAVAELSSAIERVSRSLQNDEQKWDLQEINRSSAMTRRALDGLLATDHNMDSLVTSWRARKTSSSTETARSAIARPLQSERELKLQRREQRLSAQSSRVPEGGRVLILGQVKPQRRPQIDDNESKAQAQLTYDSAAQLPVGRSSQYQAPITSESTQEVDEKMQGSQMSDQASRQSKHPYQNYATALTALEKENFHGRQPSSRWLESWPNMHSASVTGVGDTYYCKISDDCSALVFDSRYELSKHMKLHRRQYRCQHEACTRLQGFTTRDELVRHEREMHDLHGGPNTELLCPVSGRERNSGIGPEEQINLAEHVRRVYRNESQGQIRQDIVDESDAVVLKRARNTAAARKSRANTVEERKFLEGENSMVSEETDGSDDEEAEDSTIVYTDPVIALLREWTTVDV